MNKQEAAGGKPKITDEQKFAALNKPENVQDAIKFLLDSQTSQWFEFETKVRKIVMDTFENHTKQLEGHTYRLEKCDKTFMFHMNQIREMQYIMGQGSDMPNKFQEIEHQIQLIKTERNSDIHTLLMEAKDFQKKVEGQIQVFDIKLDRINDFEKQLKQAIATYEMIDKKMEQHKEQLKMELAGNLEQINLDVKEKSQKVSEAMYKMLEIEPLLVDIKLTLKKYDNADALHERLLNEMAAKIEGISGQKLGVDLYNEFKSYVEDNFKDLSNNYQLQIDRQLNMENYVEKYLPIYINRQLSEVMDIVLMKKQLAKYRKYNEFKMPMLMEAMFRDNGIPELQKFQREFHAEIMTGFVSEHEQLLKGATKNKKNEQRLKMRLQSLLPDRDMINKGFQAYNPIKNAKLQQNPTRNSLNEVSKRSLPVVIQSPEFAQNSSEQFQTISDRSVQKGTRNNNQQSPLSLNRNRSQYVRMVKDKSDNYLIETPNEQQYKGVYPLQIPDITPEDAKLLGMVDENPDLALSKIYDNDVGDHHTNHVSVSQTHIEEEEEDDEEAVVNSDGSVDMEEMLKQEIKSEIKEKITGIDNKLKVYFDEHNAQCKKEFLAYEAHFKDNMSKMNLYIQEMSDTISHEISGYKKEKDDQVIINNMLVKKMQKIEKFSITQGKMNEQIQVLAMIFESFLKVFNACEQAEFESMNQLEHMLNDFQSANIESLANQTSKRRLGVNHGVNTNPSEKNGSAYKTLMDYANSSNDLPQQDDNKFTLNVKKLFLDPQGKPIPESTITAMKIALNHQKFQAIRLPDVQEQVREFTKVDILPTYKSIQNLMHECLGSISDIKTANLSEQYMQGGSTMLGFNKSTSGNAPFNSHSEAPKKFAIYKSRTRESSPHIKAVKELYEQNNTLTQAESAVIEQRIANSRLLQGGPPNIMAPTIKFRSTSNVGPAMYQTSTSPKIHNITAHINTIFSDPKKKKVEKARSRLEDSLYLTTTGSKDQQQSSVNAPSQVHIIPQPPLKPTPFVLNEEESVALISPVTNPMLSPKIYARNQKVQSVRQINMNSPNVMMADYRKSGDTTIHQQSSIHLSQKSYNGQQSFIITNSNNAVLPQISFGKRNNLVNATTNFTTGEGSTTILPGRIN